MREIVWQITEPTTARESQPTDPDRARARLERGNLEFTALFDEGTEATRRLVQLAPEELGVTSTGEAPEQRPFAGVLSCADARVPVELLLSQRANDLFVVRVAGGVLSEGTLGSLDFAVERLPSLQLTLSLGHTRCGAVNQAVDTYLDPPSYLSMGDSRPMLALVQNLLGAVRLAAHTLDAVYGADVCHRPGYRASLVDLAVVANAGLVASSIAVRIGRHGGPSSRRIHTYYGVYDLVSRKVGLPGTATEWTAGLTRAPIDPEPFAHSLREMAFGPRVNRMLDDEPRAR